MQFAVPSRDVSQHRESNFPADAPLKTIDNLIEIAGWTPETVEQR